MIPAILLKGVEPVTGGKPTGGERASALRLLAQLEPGQILSARVDGRLADGSYKVMVAGQQLRMTLPSYVAPGDTLELAFVTHEPRLTFVLRDAARAAAGQAPMLSAAGRLVAATMPRAGQALLPVTVAATTALFAAPPADGAPLSGALAQALARSGLFYESHQAEWIAGKRDLAQLRLEPQGRLALSAGSRAAGAAAPGTSAAASAATPTAGASGHGPAAAQPFAGAIDLSAAVPERAALVPAAAPAVPAGTAQRAAASAPESTTDATRVVSTRTAAAAAPPAEHAIHPRSTPLVQHQLAALDTARVLLQLEIWPGQWLQWEIEEHQPGPGREPDEAQSWNTQLRLELPQLGTLSAALKLGGDGMRVRLRAASAASAALLQAHRADLQAALAAAGMPSAGISVACHEPG